MAYIVSYSENMEKKNNLILFSRKQSSNMQFDAASYIYMAKKCYSGSL